MMPSGEGKPIGRGGSIALDQITVKVVRMKGGFSIYILGGAEEKLIGVGSTPRNAAITAREIIEDALRKEPGQ